MNLVTSYCRVETNGNSNIPMNSAYRNNLKESGVHRAMATTFRNTFSWQVESTLGGMHVAMTVSIQLANCEW